MLTPAKTWLLSLQQQKENFGGPLSIMATNEIRPKGGIPSLPLRTSVVVRMCSTAGEHAVSMSTVRLTPCGGSPIPPSIL